MVHVTVEDLIAIGVALGLGLLVGLQREWRQNPVAGIRTFALMGLLGAIVGLMASAHGGAAWLLGLGMLALVGVMAIGNRTGLDTEQDDPGVTTEVAALVTYGSGALAGLQHIGEALVIAGTTAVLLHWKGKLHGWVRRIGERELRGVMHLVLIALVVLPVLPDDQYGPFDVINPFRAWLLVVLIVGISLAAYLVHRLMGPEKGAIVGGVLGGLISSTATTVSYARQVRASADLTPLATLVVLVASAVVNVRIAVELAVAAPGLLPAAALPLGAQLAVMTVLVVIEYLRVGKTENVTLEHAHPSQLKAALVFGLLYVVVLVAVAAAREWLGEGALYAVAGISGLTDVDAITLSTAELHDAGRVATDTAWRAIVLANASNLLFKWALMGALGGRRLLLRGALPMGLSIATGVAIVALWPEAWVLGGD